MAGWTQLKDGYELRMVVGCCQELKDEWLCFLGSQRAEAADMNGRFQMQGGKNWILPKQINANRFFRDSHWLEIWSNHFCPSMGLNGGSVATDSVNPVSHTRSCIFLLTSKESDKHSYLQYVIIMVIGQAIQNSQCS